MIHYYLLDQNIFWGSINVLIAQLPLGCYFLLIESNQRSRQKKPSTLPAGSYAFFALRALQRLNRHSRHRWPGFLSTLRSFFISGHINVSCSPSAEQLRAKLGKTMVACALERALAMLAEERAWRERIVGQDFAARGFT